MNLAHILDLHMLLDPRVFVGRSCLLEPPTQQPTGEGYKLDGNVAVVSVDGALRQRAEYGYDGYDYIATRFGAALADPNADAVLLRVRSPGGQAAGAFETVKSMVAAKKAAGKPVVSYADEHAYSGGYAIASVGDKIFLPEAGGVGSVGVISVLEDYSKMNERIGLNVAVITSGKRKADGHPDVPLTPEVIAREQEVVDHLAGIFAGLVGESRGMSKEDVLKLDADTFEGFRAVDAGLADGIASYSQALGIASSEGRKVKQKRTEKTMFGQLAKKLGLPEASTETDVLARIDALCVRSTGADAFMQSLAEIVGKSGQEALGAVKALKEQAAEVPALTRELSELKSAKTKAEVEAEVDAKIKAGHLRPASRDYAIKLGTKDPEMYRGYMDEHTTPIVTVVSDGGEAPKQAGHTGTSSALDETEKKLCEQLNVSEAEYIKTRDHQAKHGPTAK